MSFFFCWESRRNTVVGGMVRWKEWWLGRNSKGVEWRGERNGEVGGMVRWEEWCGGMLGVWPCSSGLPWGGAKLQKMSRFARKSEPLRIHRTGQYGSGQQAGPRAEVAKVARSGKSVTSHLTKTEGVTLSRKLSWGSYGGFIYPNLSGGFPSSKGIVGR